MARNRNTQQLTHVIRELNGLEGKAETVIKRTLSDVRSRAPGWVASEVVKGYAIAKAEVKPEKVRTRALSDVTIDYKGKRLSPAHFKMAPTAPAPGGSYTLKATIVKGKRSTLGKVKKLTKKQRANIGRNFTGQGTRSSDHSPIMLMNTGKKSEGAGFQYIPFQRKSTDRTDIVPIKNISVPQMVTGSRNHDAVYAAIREKLGKRIEHHMKLITR